MSVEMPQPRKGRPFWGLLFCLCLLAAGCSADTALVDFAALARSTTPNDSLACPADFCSAKVDFVTEAAPLSAPDLAAKVVAVIGAEPRTELAMKDADGLHLVFVQRSRLMRFPDTVNIAITPVDAGHATIAIYSRSNYGYGDFGVNLARVEDWLTKLGIAATPSS